MKKVFFAMFVFVASLVLVGCNAKEKEGTGYGLVHGHYVGEVNVKMSGKKIKEMSIEEYFLPYNAGQIAAKDEWKEVNGDEIIDKAPANVVVKVNANTGARTYYAKFFYVNGEVYEGSLDNSNNIQYLKGGVNIEAEVKDEAKAKAYVEAVKAGKVFIVDSATAATKSTELVVTGNAAKAMTKSESGYWSGANYPLGWKGNMEEVIKAMIADYEGTFALNADKKWASADFVSGATLSDFKDYQAVTQRAVANAK
ncbi:hypothetical protein [Acholeplasma hippikon]|uniref:Major membrane immunogen, membrane-anchored lipoprotein n=1 Tax=Acholeplasma hippikon TaxID=264636 RepID=A0A449BIU6_9MOLU|nr:hypothetical protein [Acholeplasma hippikon]VEU82358.1 Uncharacterised protein [Acholeplasma hippikon]